MDKDTIKRLIRESELMACSCGYCEEKVEALAGKLAGEEEDVSKDDGAMWVLPLKVGQLYCDIVDHGEHLVAQAYSNGGEYVCSFRRDFIIKAVNNHATLVRALRAIKDWSTSSAKWRLVAERHGIDQQYEVMTHYVDSVLREVDS